jgi:hypothetical protein
LALAKGEFIIDFATDDVMMPERIARQIQSFSLLDDSYGVVFTDAVYINEHGKVFRDHYEYLFRKRLIKSIPEGDVYKAVLTTYFIASPTMMARKVVMDVLHGYDEELSYEDFDFWIRSSRLFKYKLLNEPLTQIRKIGRSMSAGWYTPGDPQLHSTYVVCRKARALNRTADENMALAKRLKYELRQSVFSQNHQEAILFYKLLKEIRRHSVIDLILYQLNKLRLPLGVLRNLYHQLRFR